MNRALSFFHEFAVHDVVLLQVGKSEITLGQLLSILIGVTLLFLFSGWLRRLIANRLLAHGHVNVGTRQSIASLVRYVVLVIGFMAIMQTAGINLSAFSLLAGAVGVGIGFGLQNVVSNFISGLIVMFERPVRIGDRVELGGVEGDVLEIGARATRIVTAEGSVVIMPNQKFITDPVKNWADIDERSPLVLNVSIEKSGNLRQTAELLCETVRAHPGVEPHPPAQVWLTGISGNGAFRILAWVNGSASERSRIMHELYLAIVDALAAKGIKLA